MAVDTPPSSRWTYVNLWSPDRASKNTMCAVQAVTALHMVEPSQQWLLDPAPLHQALRPPMAYTNTDHPSTSNTPTSTTALSRCKAGIARSIVVLSSSSSQAVSSGCQYTDLTKEHAAAHAHALLAGLDADAAHQPTVADDCFHQALQLGESSTHCFGLLVFSCT